MDLEIDLWRRRFAGFNVLREYLSKYFIGFGHFLFF